jgi:hypothetical protein
MHTPTTVNLSATAALTERGHLTVQLFCVRDAIRPLGPADRAWAADALVLLLAECRCAGPANGKGAWHGRGGRYGRLAETLDTGGRSLSPPGDRGGACWPQELL